MRGKKRFLALCLTAAMVFTGNPAAYGSELFSDGESGSVTGETAISEDYETEIEETIVSENQETEDVFSGGEAEPLAEGFFEQGKCGDNLTYTISENEDVNSVGHGYTLTISGTGPMYDYEKSQSSPNQAPWRNCGTGGVFITQVNIQEGITYIGSYAFWDFATVEHPFRLPDSITRIGRYALRGLWFEGETPWDGYLPKKLEVLEECSLPSGKGRLVLPSTLKEIGDDVFWGNWEGPIVLPKGLKKIGREAFYKCEGFTGDLVIPDSVTTLGDFAFWGCTGLNGKLQIGSGLNALPSGVFRGCTGLTGNLTIPGNIKQVGWGAFEDCTGFNGKLSISEGVNSLAAESFMGCSKIKEAVLPASLTELNGGAFSECSGLEKIYFKGKMPVIYGNPFYGITVDGYYPASWSSAPSPDFYGGTFTWHKWDGGGNSPAEPPKEEPGTGIRTITFNPNGKGAVASVSQKTVTDGKKYGTLPTAKRKNYVFTGWYTGKTGGTKVTADTVVKLTKNQTLYARWKKGGYLTYDLNGGTNSKKNPGHYYSKDGLTLSNPVRKGYTFKGWYTDSRFASSGKVTGFKAGTYGDKKFYAKWEANKYTVKYSRNGASGGTMQATVHVYDTYKALPANGFTRTGYHFTGWNTRADGSGKSYKNQQKVKNLISANGKTVILYAQWEISTYKVVYSKNSSKATGTMKADSMKCNSAKRLKANAFKQTGYYFAGWNTKPDGSGKSYKDKEAVKNLTTTNGKAVTLYAQWNVNKYTIVYHGMGGTGSMLKTYCFYGKTYTLRKNAFTKQHCRFKGWTRGHGASVVYKDEDRVKNLARTNDEIIHLYASWDRDAYTIRFSGEGKTSGTMEDKKAYCGDEVLLPEMTYKKTGYHFKGWAKTRGGKAVYKNKETLSSLTLKRGAVITLYPVWEANTYTVKFNGNGASNASMASVKQTYGKNYPLPANTFKLSGYHFKGWSTSETGAPKYTNKADVKNLTTVNKGTVTLYAQWGYDLQYKANLEGASGSMADVLVLRSHNIIMAANGYKLPGYEFLGWNTKADGSGTAYQQGQTLQGTSLKPNSAGKAVLYAQWRKNVCGAPVDLSLGHWYALTYPGHEGPEPFQKYATDWNMYANGQWDADNGVPVRAIADGKVELSIYNNGSIRIRHSVDLALRSGYVYPAYQWFSWYGHMKNIVPNGTVVKKGDVIGYISNFSADNNHLHFSVYGADYPWGAPTVGISPYWIPGDLSNAGLYADDTAGTREPAWVYYDLLLNDAAMPK